MTEPEGPAWMDAAAARRVRAQLQAAFTEDTPIPAEVAARLHDRLAVETTAPTDEAPAPVTTLPVGARRPIPRRWVAAAAGIVLLAVGVGVALTHHGHATPSASTASEAQGSVVPNQSKAAALPTSRVTHSGAVLATAADLDAHTRDLISGSGTTAEMGEAAPQAAGAQTSPAVPAPSQRPLEDTIAGGLTACLASLDDSKVPIAVDEVTYEGKDSLLALFPGEKAKQVDVFVVGPACGAAPPDGVRDFRTVPVG